MLDLHFIKNALGLQEKDHIVSEENGKILKLVVFSDVTEQICPECGLKTTRIHDYRTQNVKTVNVVNKQTILVLKKRRYVCPHCGKRFYEYYDFIANKAYKMMREKRIKFFAPADYSDGTELDKIVKAIIDRTCANEKLEKLFYKQQKEQIDNDKEQGEEKRNKVEAILKLKNSFSYAATHIAVENLNKIGNWTADEREELFKIAIENSQDNLKIVRTYVRDKHYDVYKFHSLLDSSVGHMDFGPMQSEALTLKYIPQLIRLKTFLQKQYGIGVLENINKYPLDLDIRSRIFARFC